MILSIILLGFFIPSRLIKENIHYSIYDKHKLLEKSNNGARIILVGGSNLSFGILSPLIEEEFGKDVINTAIHAGYGLKYIIDDIKPFVKEGDVIIFSPEYSHFYNDLFNGAQAMVQGLNVYPQNFRNLNLKQFLVVLKFLPRESFVKIRSYLRSFRGSLDIVNAYHRKSFNSHGDAIKHWKLPRSKGVHKVPLKGDFNNVAYEYVIDFDIFVKEKNASMYFSFPCLNRSSYEVNREKIEYLDSLLAKSDINVLGNSLEFSTPDSLHFDTHYHLIKEGQILRTNLLIDAMRSAGLN